jgi:hypothetical protein
MKNPEDYLITDKIKYFHGSLKTYVNGSSKLIKEMVVDVYKDDIEKYQKQDEENFKKHIQFLNKRKEIINKKLNILKSMKENQTKSKRFNNILSFGK